MKHWFRFIAPLLLASALATVAAQPQGSGVRIGAFDAARANQLIIAGPNQTFFALRFLVHRAGAEGEDAARIADLGPQASDGRAGRISWFAAADEKSPVVLRWARTLETKAELKGAPPTDPKLAAQVVIVGSIVAPSGARLTLETLRPFADEKISAVFATTADRRAILGEQVQKTSSSLQQFLLKTNRAADLVARDAQGLRAISQQSPQPNEAVPPGRRAAFDFDLSQTNQLNFAIALGGDPATMEEEADRALKQFTPALLDAAEKSAVAAAPASSGALGDSLDVIHRLMNWNRFYLPETSSAEKPLAQLTLNRLPTRAVRQGALGWDGFFNSTVAVLLDPTLAAANLRALLDGQLPDGRVPLRRNTAAGTGDDATTRGRSMPPVGALCTWRVYQATRDLELLAWAYPRLRLWNQWWLANRNPVRGPAGEVVAQWRDGNNDGLLEWGADVELELGALGTRTLSAAAKQRLAFEESGLADRPQWLDEPQAKFNDRTHTLEFSPVGLNALYALDLEMLALMARELGITAEADQWQARYEAVKKLIDEKLWNEEAGLYLNRGWDGKFSARLSLENFYPLLAGIPDEVKAKKMLAVLRDPQRFGLDALPPAIARDDAAFDGKTIGRGASWALMNHLLYLGLKRAGLTEDAARLARSSAKAAATSDVFSATDNSAVESDGSFALLARWPAAEELITLDPQTGIGFGSLDATEESRIDRLNYLGASFDVILSPKHTVIRRNGRIEVEVEAPAQIRNYENRDVALTFTITLKEQTRLRVPAIEGRKITASVDGKVLGSASAGATATFKVPAGTHKVLIVK